MQNIVAMVQKKLAKLGRKLDSPYSVEYKRSMNLSKETWWKSKENQQDQQKPVWDRNLSTKFLGIPSFTCSINHNSSQRQTKEHTKE